MPQIDQFTIVWKDKGKEPSCAPNPAYPNGIALDATAGKQPNCIAELPYPAKRVGDYHIECRLCHYRAVVTTAGRPDDPVSVKLPCKFNPARPTHA